MGQVLKTLEDNGIDQRTLVIWTSDNGPFFHRDVAHGSVGPLQGCGYSTDEGGMRMPFLARWPGRIPPGRESDELATAMDLLPTIAKLAGGKTPPRRRVRGPGIL